MKEKEREKRLLDLEVNIIGLSQKLSYAKEKLEKIDKELRILKKEKINGKT